MPFMPEARYMRYMEIGDIKQQMRRDLADGKLNPLQKSLFEERPAEFLFDIENDLWETKNLAEDPDYKNIIGIMREQLRSEILGSRDVMFLPEYEVGLLDTVPAYEFRLNDEKYPLAEIHEAASLSGFRGKDITEKQVKLLSHQVKYMRYWGAIGLVSQKNEDLKSNAEEIIKAMEDDYPPVAVTAAAIAYQEFDNSRAFEKLKKYCDDENLDIALMAINYLKYMDNKEPFAETIKAVRKKPGLNYEIKAASVDFLGILGLVPNTPEYAE
jgi:hypothetical protein